MPSNTNQNALMGNSITSLAPEQSHTRNTEPNFEEDSNPCSNTLQVSPAPNPKNLDAALAVFKDKSRLIYLPDPSLGSLKFRVRNSINIARDLLTNMMASTSSYAPTIVHIGYIKKMKNLPIEDTKLFWHLWRRLRRF